MPDLTFQIEGAEPVPYAASPQLAFGLRIIEKPTEGQPPAHIHSVVLRCQVRIDPVRRRYAPREQADLVELFGAPHRWGQTVRSMLWANVGISVPPFTAHTRIDLPVPCTYDFHIATTKYFAALEGGQVPLSFLFSGSIFYAAEDQSLLVEQISWEKEASFALPVRVWRQTMDLYYPNTAWLCLRQDVFDRLRRYKSSRAMPTWEQAIESLLTAAEDPLCNEAAP